MKFIQRGMEGLGQGDVPHLPRDIPYKLRSTIFKILRLYNEGFDVANNDYQLVYDYWVEYEGLQKILAPESLEALRQWYVEQEPIRSDDIIRARRYLTSDKKDTPIIPTDPKVKRRRDLLEAQHREAFSNHY